MIDLAEDKEIMKINKDFQDINEEINYIKNSSNLEIKQNEEEEENDEYSLISNSNYYNQEKDENEFDKDIDPNFQDKYLQKEEEKRRRKEIEEFEKRTSSQDNIIDFDEINYIDEKELKLNDVDINSNNSNFITKNKKNIFEETQKSPKLNNMNIDKNKLINKINNYENESEEESKITQMKNNHINSYEKDDISSNNVYTKDKSLDLKIINNKTSGRYYEQKKIISDNKEEINSNKETSEYNMDFYDTNRMSKDTNHKNYYDVFDTLLPNKTFKKFLKSKIKYYMKEEDIPKDFIQNLNLEESKNNKNIQQKDIIKNITQKKISHYNNKNSTINYTTIENSNLYNDDYPENLSYQTRPKSNINNIKNINNKSMKNFYRKHHMDNGDINNNYNSNYDKYIIENKKNKEKIKDLKKELNIRKKDINEKLNKINMLENMNDNLKNEMNKLKINYEYERINNKETKKNYDLIKSNYTDIKNQYDLLNIKYITLNDENFNYRRDKDLYEKQIKTKNEIIENLIENNTNIKKNNINNKLNKINYDTKSSNEIISDYIKKNSNNKKNKEENNISNKTDKKSIDYNKFDKLTFPELQCKRDELSKERADTYNIYCKIPLKSNSKEQINKRNMLEKKLEEINCDLMIVKLRIKNFKNNK